MQMNFLSTIALPFSRNFVKKQSYKLDCAQRAQTSAEASNLSQKWSDIRIQILGLIRIWIRLLWKKTDRWL